MGLAIVVATALATYYVSKVVPIWGLIVIGLTLPYWLGPLLIRLRSRYGPGVTFVPCERADARLPGWVTRYLDETVEALAPVGFGDVGRFRQAEWSPNVIIITVVLRHPRGDAAYAAAMYTKTGGTRLRYLEFVTRFAGGETIATNNSRQPRVWAPVRQRRVEQFPGVREPALLYRIHEARVADAGDAPREDPLATGDVEGTLRQAVLREMGAQREAGYVYVDPGTGAYRPTWKGAALMTWRLLWPMKTIARARLRRRASALVAALNV
jgi:hypothetical protein